MSCTTQAYPLMAPELLDEPSVQPRVGSPTVPATRRVQEASVWSLGKHCPELDGVRGMAILLVTLYRILKEFDPNAHEGLRLARRYCEFGERGVDLFFVLSGFLITGILLHTKSSEGYFKNFIVRRALRIFPLYFTALLVCLYLLPAALGTHAFDLPRSEQFYLWTYTSNLRMAWLNAWSFGPLDHFWSLAVEEHFYLIWPAIVFFLSPKALFRLSVGMVIVVGVTRTALALRPEFGLAVDTLTLLRCDALCLGAILAVAMYQGLRTEQVNRIAMRTLPLLVILSVLVAWSGKRWMGIPHTLFGLLWVVLMAVVVTRTRSNPMSRFLRLQPLQWLGKYSYGMYVIQLPLLTLLPLPALTIALGWSSMHPLVVAGAYTTLVFVLIGGIAYASFQWLEKPFLGLKRYFDHGPSR